MPVLDRPVILPYLDAEPVFDRASARLEGGAAVLGRVRMGRNAVLGPRSLIRADGHYVEIGDDFHLGSHGTVHIAHEVYPTHIGNGVTAGDGAVIHACDVGDGCHLGDGAIVLDGSTVAAGCALGAGAVVFPRSTLEGGFLYEGAPAKPVRRLEESELERLHAQTRAKRWATPTAAGWDTEPLGDGHVFVAASARLKGRISCAGENGIWFGCDLDGGDPGIEVGANTNIQDNTTIVAERRKVTIGADATIGHNVTMTDCSVGDRSLVGIGATVAPGTRIGRDVLLAAGAATVEDQVLEDGGFYVGSPARRLSEIDDAKKTLIALTWPTYCAYARNFKRAQDVFLAALD